MSKVAFRIIDCSRTIRKIVTSSPELASILAKAHEKGLFGTKLVLADDGAEIEDDDDVVACQKEAFMILQEHEVWSAALIPADSVVSLLQDSKPVFTEPNFENYKIPINKFPSVVVDCLATGKTVVQYLTPIVHIIVGDMRTISKKIPISVFRKIVKYLVATYPLSFEVTDQNGEIVSKKHELLITKMHNHNTHLNARDNIADCVPPKQRKKQQILASVVPNLQATPSTSSSVTTEKMQQLLKDVVFADDEHIRMMNDCFDKVQNDVTKMTIGELLNEWPLLFKQPCLGQHFKTMTALAVLPTGETVTKKLQTILSYAKFQRPKATRTFLKENVRMANEVLAAKYVVFYFKETWSDVFFTIDVDSVDPISDGPVIVTKDGRFSVTIKNTEIFQAEQFVDAFIAWFELYFVLKPQDTFPRSISQSLDFVQRHMFQHNSVESKSMKRSIDAAGRVLGLISKINKFATEDEVDEIHMNE